MVEILVSRIHESRHNEVITRLLVDRPSGRMACWYDWPGYPPEPDLSCWVLGSTRYRYGGRGWNNLRDSDVHRYLIHGQWPPPDTGN